MSAKFSCSPKTFNSCFRTSYWSLSSCEAYLSKSRCFYTYITSYNTSKKYVIWCVYIYIDIYIYLYCILINKILRNSRDLLPLLVVCSFNLNLMSPRINPYNGICLNQISCLSHFLLNGSSAWFLSGLLDLPLICLLLL